MDDIQTILELQLLLLRKTKELTQLQRRVAELEGKLKQAEDRKRTPKPKGSQ